jgi:hypothetical protein
MINWSMPHERGSERLSFSIPHPFEPRSGISAHDFFTTRPRFLRDIGASFTRWRISIGPWSFAGHICAKRRCPISRWDFCGCAEVRRLGFDETQIRSYPHRYPNRRGIQPANIYANAWLGTFRDWVQRVYLKDAFVKYIHRQSVMPLMSPEATNGLNAGLSHHLMLTGNTTSQGETRKDGGPGA